MKKEKIYTVIAYCLLLFAVVVTAAGCRTKKSTLQQRKSEKENISLIDKSQEQKTEKVQETTAIASREAVNEKHLIVEWMSIKSDEATFEDKAGNKWTFKNPVMDKKSSQNTETTKDKQSVADSSKVSENNQKKQSDVKANVDKESTSELSTSDESKTKVVWLYCIGGLVLGGCCFLGAYYIKKIIF